MSARPQPPEQIVGAWQAWLATCVLQVAGALTTLAINLLNPGALLEVPGMGGQSVGDAFPELAKVVRLPQPAFNAGPAGEGGGRRRRR